MMTRRGFMQGSAGLMLGSALPGHGWAAGPSVANRLLYGYPPGATGSRLANACLPLLDGDAGPNYRLENLDGRNTRLASEMAVKSPADGSTLLQVLSSSLTLTPSLYKTQTFDPLRDFQPLALMGDFPFALALGPMVPKTVVNLQQYLDWVVDNPEARNIGVSIYGSLAYLAVRILARDTDSSVRVLPYNGTAAVLDDLRNQNLAAAFLTAGSDVSADPNAVVRAIGVTTRQRLSFWPQIPSLHEQGCKTMDLTGWFGWFAPAAVPEKIIDPLLERIARMQTTQGYAAIQKKLLLTQVSMNPDEIRSRMSEEIGLYRALVRDYRINQMD